MNLTPQAQAAAQAVLDYHDLFENQRHDQGDWVHGARDFSTTSFDGVKTQVCDSSMCAAGTVGFLFASKEDFKSMNEDDFFNIGKEVLELAYDEAYDLFYNTDNEEAREILEAIAQGDKDKAERLLEEV